MIFQIIEPYMMPLIYGATCFIAVVWLAMLALLPVAIYQNKLRLLAREAGYFLNSCATFAGCVFLYFLTR